MASFSRDQVRDQQHLATLLGSRYHVRSSKISATALHIMIERNGVRVAEYWPSTGRFACGRFCRKQVAVDEIPALLGAHQERDEHQVDPAILSETIAVASFAGRTWEDLPIETIQELHATTAAVLKLRLYNWRIDLGELLWSL